jgi:hypothetical protein
LLSYIYSDLKAAATAAATRSKRRASPRKATASPKQEQQLLNAGNLEPQPGGSQEQGFGGKQFCI